MIILEAAVYEQTQSWLKYSGLVRGLHRQRHRCIQTQTRKHMNITKIVSSTFLSACLILKPNMLKMARFLFLILKHQTSHTWCPYLSQSVGSLSAFDSCRFCFCKHQSITIAALVTLNCRSFLPRFTSITMQLYKWIPTKSPFTYTQIQWMVQSHVAFVVLCPSLMCMCVFTGNLQEICMSSEAHLLHAFI